MTAKRSVAADSRDDIIAAVRQFNRFYTTRIGALDKGHLHTEFGLTEMRVLYELANRDGLTARDLASDLSLDPAYLSRLLQRFRTKRLVSVSRSTRDARERVLALTAKGRSTFAPLNKRASDAIAEMLDRLVPNEQLAVVRAMRIVQQLFGARDAQPTPIVLRPHRAGDIGWVIERHGALYAQEFGFNSEFEALVAKVAAEFLESFDAAREHCWIAERNGERVGSVFLVKKSSDIAQLRLLLVEPSARGLGIGEQLVVECERFARAAGYRSISLWTQSNLSSARRIYERAGYRRVSSKRHASFGAKLVAEDWEKTFD